MTDILSPTLRKMGIEALNEMQRAAVEHCARCNSMVLLSPTGTGKTLAYLLPLLQRLDEAAGGLQALIVVPSRELAQQVAEVWRTMQTPHRMVALYGGRPTLEEAALLQNVSPAAVVGTPGRLIDHLRQGNLLADACRVLVIDEFDKCLEMGFCDEMQQLLELLPGVDSRFLLSATDCDEIPRFAGADGAERLDFRARDEQPSARTAFYTVTTTPEDRLQALFGLLCSLKGEPAIVFCNFRETVEEVRSHLAKGRLIVSAYHGALEQKERELALYRFSSGCSNILVSTDLAARGLDIKDVRHVIHFQRPMTADIFTHRNGRTARWDAEGAVYIISYHNHPLPEFVPEDIREYRLKGKYPLPPAPDWTPLYIGKGKRDKISRGDLAGFFMKKGGLAPQNVGSILVFDRYAYVAVQYRGIGELLRRLAGEKIKGLKTKIEIVRG